MLMHGREGDVLSSPRRAKVATAVGASPSLGAAPASLRSSVARVAVERAWFAGWRIAGTACRPGASRTVKPPRARRGRAALAAHRSRSTASGRCGSRPAPRRRRARGRSAARPAAPGRGRRRRPSVARAAPGRRWRRPAAGASTTRPMPTYSAVACPRSRIGRRCAGGPSHGGHGVCQGGQNFAPLWTATTPQGIRRAMSRHRTDWVVRFHRSFSLGT